MGLRLILPFLIDLPIRIIYQLNPPFLTKPLFESRQKFRQDIDVVPVQAACLRNILQTT